MTLLGILFVVGVAFLATMNFEADMISAERQRQQSVGGVEAAMSDVGTIMRNTVMAAPGVPFGDGSALTSRSGFSEMPGVHHSFSPIEPYYVAAPGPDNQLNTPDDPLRLSWGSYFVPAQSGQNSIAHPGLSLGTDIITGSINELPVNGAMMQLYFVRYFDPATSNWVTTGVNLMRCTDGPLKGSPCTVAADCQAVAGVAIYSCEGPRMADADGDGIVDSLLVDGKELGLSDAQLADLAARVNPVSDLGGKVSVALRVVPHGGMINLNQSHPTLIQNVFDLQTWPTPLFQQTDPDSRFRHGPTQDLLSYQPTLEEPLLRRRGNVPPRVFEPSVLHGSPLVNDASDTGAHLPWQLFWWSNASGFQDVFSSSAAAEDARGHRFTPFSPTELYPDEPNFLYWQAMMEPQSATLASPPPSWNPSGTGLVYDRRHLVTTVSHDDLFARTAMVESYRGEVDLRQAMIEANWSPPGMADPDKVDCDPIVAFEYMAYPNAVGCCMEDTKCVRPDNRNGRMQLSLPWIDDQLAAAADPSLTALEQERYRARIFRIIHDVFFMLVRNAARKVEVEGMSCTSDRDCPIVDTVCRLNGAVVAAGDTGYCVHAGHPSLAVFTSPTSPMGAGCLSAGCGVPDALCRFDGVCALAAPAWNDVVCSSDGTCRSSEFCMIPTGATSGLCADRWTRQRRSEAAISRTAASLTANLIDFADADDAMTKVAIRDFEFVTKCVGGTNHNLPCPAFDCSTGGGRCPERPIGAGREIDVSLDVNPLVEPPGPCAGGQCLCREDRDCVIADPKTPLCSTNKFCIRPQYVYGLERQPYITEVATLAKGPPGAVDIVGRVIEMFNPFPTSISLNNNLNNEYFILEVPPNAPNLSGLVPMALQGDVPGNSGLTLTGPFAWMMTADPAFRADMSGNAPTIGQITVAGDLKFENDWTIYLLRSIDPADPNAPKVVVDQFHVTGDLVGITDEPTLIGSGCDPQPGGMPLCRFSAQRAAPVPTPPSQPASVWNWTVPRTWEAEETDHVTLGEWNHAQAVFPEVHPVEVNFADTGAFGLHYNSTTPPSFPTTGSITLVMRHANRDTRDYTPNLSPSGTNGTVSNLAFTSQLVGGVSANYLIENPVGSGLFQPVSPDFKTEEQIDNGRLPIFDAGTFVSGTGAGFYSMHHLQPRMFKPWDPTGSLPNCMDRALPGELATLPWGQLVFDYFTALPLLNGGPYDIDPAGNYLSLENLPKVDQGGMRVHGRVNINAAPWKVLAGLPFMPPVQLPFAFRDKIANAVGISPTETQAQPIGEFVAKSMAAYRDARAINELNDDGTGDYASGDRALTNIVVPAPPAYARGWTHREPMVRRGTGFMSVGELANVRHPGATPDNLFGTYRFDISKIDGNATNNNTQGFVEAAALLIGLGDWVTVRSHVMTVYGQIRGADDPAIADPAQRLIDTDARAIRFQETIDRFPVLMGQPRPQRIGDRVMGRYADVNND